MQGRPKKVPKVAGRPIDPRRTKRAVTFLTIEEYQALGRLALGGKVSVSDVLRSLVQVAAHGSDRGSPLT